MAVRSGLVAVRRRYNLSAWAIKLNEITPGLEQKLAPTDCRLRPDQHATEAGDYDEVRPAACAAGVRAQALKEPHRPTRAVSAASGVSASLLPPCFAGQPAEAAAGDQAAGGAQGGRERGGHAAALVQAAGHNNGRGHRLRERPHRIQPLPSTPLTLQICALQTCAPMCTQRL